MRERGRQVLLLIAAIVTMAAISACSPATDTTPNPTSTVSNQTPTPTSEATSTPTERATTVPGTATATTTPATPSPTLRPTSTPSPTPTPTPEAIAFNVDEDVDGTDYHAIALGVELAESFLADSGGGSVERTVFVRITTSNECAHGVSARGYIICANVDNSGWRGLDFGERVKVAAHEYYHVLQHELGCYDVPQWIFEGAAEFVSFRVMTDAGFLEPQAATLAAIARVLDVFGTPPALINDISRRPAGLDEYAYWALAMDQLTLVPGITSLRTFCADVGGGTSWREAFVASFGQTPTEFTSAFRDQSETWLP